MPRYGILPYYIKQSLIWLNIIKPAVNIRSVMGLIVNYGFDKMILNDTDRKILNILQDNGRITNAKLAAEVGISPPAMLERVKRLEASGIIRKFAAILDKEKAGYGILAIVTVSLSVHQRSYFDEFMEKIREMDEVLECFQISGQEDFILKVVLEGIGGYKDFVNRRLAGIAGIQNVKSSFVLDTVKCDTRLKL